MQISFQKLMARSGNFVARLRNRQEGEREVDSFGFTPDPRTLTEFELLGRQGAVPLTSTPVQVTSQTEARVVDGKAMIRLLSASRKASQNRAHDQGWSLLHAGAKVDSEGESLSLQAKVQLPGAEEMIVLPQPDGNLRVTRIAEELDTQQSQAYQFYDESRREMIRGGENLEPGRTYPAVTNRGFGPYTYLGRNAQGLHRFGHSEQFSPSEFQDYLERRLNRLAEEKEATESDRLDRETGSLKLRAELIESHGLGSLLDQPDELAQALVDNNLKLAYHGRSLWSPGVEKRVETLKRAELEQDQNLVDKGVVDLRLESWLAGQRDEILLFRGIQGDYQHRPGPAFYADCFGTALHGYALKGEQPATVVSLRVPKREAARYFRLPGRTQGLNPMVGVVDLDCQKLIQPVEPRLLVSSRNPAQSYLIQAYGRLDKMKPSEGLERFNKLHQEVFG